MRQDEALKLFGSGDERGKNKDCVDDSPHFGVFLLKNNFLDLESFANNHE